MNLLHLVTPKHSSLLFTIVICSKTVKVILIIDVLTCPRRSDSDLQISPQCPLQGFN